MMRRTNARIRIDDQGTLEVVDPGFDMLDLIRTIDPEFNVQRAELKGFTRPQLRTARTLSCGLTQSELSTSSVDDLWNTHNKFGLLAAGLASETQVCEVRASILDLKIEIARRLMQSCSLCSHQCGVNRLINEIGICGLGTEAIVAEQFIHIGEEPQINPSLVLNLAGCGLRCRFCQQSDLLRPATILGRPLNKSLWPDLSTRRARSLSFVGGNPDESLYGILRFLLDAPSKWKLPIVWNCHAYATPETLTLLDGVVDVYIPDYKYSNESCGRHLSGVKNYPPIAKRNIALMVAQGVPVIVRILVLPGHLDCCHIPSLEYLASIDNSNLLVSIRGQYCPDWRIDSKDGDLSRRVTNQEWSSVYTYAEQLGLQLIRTVQPRAT